MLAIDSHLWSLATPTSTYLRGLLLPTMCSSGQKVGVDSRQIEETWPLYFTKAGNFSSGEADEFAFERVYQYCPLWNK